MQTFRFKVITGCLIIKYLDDSIHLYNGLMGIIFNGEEVVLKIDFDYRMEHNDMVNTTVNDLLPAGSDNRQPNK